MWKMVVLFCSVGSVTTWGMNLGTYGGTFLSWSLESGAYDFTYMTTEENRCDGSRSCDIEMAVNQHDVHGNKALYHACRRGHLRKAELLLKQGAAVTGIGADLKRTALHEAVDCNHPNPKIVELLLAHDLGLLDKGDSTGQTALHKACLQGHVKIVNTLLGFGANPNIEDQAGDNAWSYATRGPEKTWHRVMTALKKSEKERLRLQKSIQEALAELGLQDLSPMICMYANCN